MPVVTADEARAIAKDAIVYGYPLVESYKTLYKQAVDHANPDYRAPFNEIASAANIATPADTWVVTPNSDTPYSFLWMDLRAEPLAISMPKIEEGRYYSAQLIDMQTFNFAYLGTRTFGNDGGDFLIAGPGWNGEQPKGTKAVIRCETQIAYALFRTQLFEGADLENVKKIQAGYKVQPLSRYLGTAAPTAAPDIHWPKPNPQMDGPAEIFDYLNFLLQFCPVEPSETSFRQRFATFGIGAGLTFDFAALSPELQRAVTAGFADVGKDMAALQERVNRNEVGSGDVFGTRTFLKNNYLYRFAAAKLGLYGNSREEAMYPAYFTDADGKPLNASSKHYTLRFEKGQLPPAGAFWSFTMYDGKTQLLVANPLNRYLVNSTMLKSFKYGDDGSLTFYIQADSPGTDNQSNWLPAPDGPLYCFMRIYMPNPEVFDGRWKNPPLIAQARSSSATGVQVTQKTYCRAESDRTFFNISRMAGGVNRFFHFRAVTPLDKQTVIRMNKDTLYSMGVVDTSRGATITVPVMPADRYFSVFLVDNDHYCPFVIYNAGTHELPKDTKYLGLGVRIQLLHPNDPADIALINKLQDQFVIKAGSADPFPEPKWDMKSLAELTAEYNTEFAKFDVYPDGCMGPRGVADENIRHLAAAGAWGLFPNKDAIYINYNGHLPADMCHCATYRIPENNAFWSITVYGGDGYMKSTNSILNATNVRMNGDGTFTVYFGSKEACGDVPNRLDVSEGWNFLMRVYRPGASVLNGSYKLPEAIPCK